MKIIFFSPTLNVGGYEKVVLEFANYLINDNKNQIVIACCHGNGEIAQLLDPRIRIIDFKCRTRNLLGNFIHILKTESPDIFYTGFRIYNVLAVIAKYLSRSKRVKICISQHGYEMNNNVVERMFGAVLSKADLFIGVTESLRKYEVSRLHLKCKSIVVGNPVIKKESEYSDKHVEISTNGNYKIVTCGRLSKDKNYILALKILKELINFGIAAELIVLGDGPEKEYLQMQTKTMQIENAVSFEGYVTNPIDYMKKCDVYLHTCDREGFGNTVVEALFSGLPIVTTDCGGPVDLIENGKYGINFGNSRDDEAAQKGAKAIISVLRESEKYKNQKKKALQFMTEKVGYELEQQFKEIL